MLESPSKPDEIKANDKVRSYFASCMADRQNQVRHASGELPFVFVLCLCTI